MSSVAAANVWRPQRDSKLGKSFASVRARAVTHGNHGADANARFAGDGLAVYQAWDSSSPTSRRRSAIRNADLVLALVFVEELRKLGDEELAAPVALKQVR